MTEASITGPRVPTVNSELPVIRPLRHRRLAPRRAVRIRPFRPRGESHADSLPTLVRLLLVDRAAIVAENLALRQQLAVALRRNQRPTLRRHDRVFWVILSRLWTDWRSALILVKPDTVVRWHRQGFRLYWRWKSRRRHGRPGVPRAVRELIRRMALANPLWGAPRIHGELLKLGIEISRRPPSPSTCPGDAGPHRPPGVAS